MKSSCSTFVGLAALVFAFTQMASADFYVTTNGTGDGSSWASPTNSIQGAIDAIGAGTVWVSNGVYNTGGMTNWPAGTTSSNRIVISKAITVRSANNDPTNTIIEGAWDPVSTNGPASVRCVYMVDNSALVGFTLRNGSTIAQGGGVKIEDFATGTVISNCIVTGNRATGYSGGIHCGTSGKIYNCKIINNMSGSCGGAMHGYYYDCLIASNSAPADGTYGGGLGSYEFGYLTAYRCTISGNQSCYAAGVYNAYLIDCAIVSNYSTGFQAVRECILTNCTVVGNSSAGAIGGVGASTAYNCLIAGNLGNGGWGVGGVAGGISYNCTIVGNKHGSVGAGGASGSTLYNCIVLFNTSVSGASNWDGTCSFTNCCTAPAQGGWAAGNITADPQFVDRNAGNYRLRSYYSPCVNTGTNGSWTTGAAVDLDGKTRISFGTVDMGAYEFYVCSGAILGFH